MLRIKRQTDYAVRVILALAQMPEGSRLTTAAIQESMQIPRAFLQRIVAQLAQSHLLQTFPGRDGGVQLLRKAEDITLRDVVESIEGPLMISECLPGDAFCPFEEHCPVRRRWARLQSVILKELSQTTFADLAKEVVG